jgi:hypothetical protein
MILLGRNQFGFKINKTIIQFFIIYVSSQQLIIIIIIIIIIIRKYITLTMQFEKMTLFIHIIYFIRCCENITAIRKSKTKAKTKP